jgi:hypothetical protein
MRHEGVTSFMLTAELRSGLPAAPVQAHQSFPVSSGKSATPLGLGLRIGASINRRHGAGTSLL